MLRLGEKCIKNLKLGDKTIFKAMKGDKLVYRNYPVFLDYIEFDGYSYINTGIKSLSTWKIGAVGEETNYLRFLIANGGAGGQLFGYHNSGYWCLGAPTEFHFNTPFTQYIDCTVTFSNGLVTATVGEQTLTRTGNTLNANYFLGGWAGSNDYYFKGKVYYCRNCNPDGTLTQDLRPCIDPCGVVCFYDMVTGKYFYNQGTGELKAGGRFVESIVFDGQSYIKTGITKEQGYDGTWTINAKCYLQEQVTGYTVLLGCGERGGRYYGKNSQDKWGLGATAGRYFDISGDILTEAEVIFNPSKITAKSGGVTLTLTGDFSTYTGSEFIIGKGLDEDSYGYTFIGEVYGCKYIDTDGNLIQDLRPYVDKNGVACFKDLVTGNLFYNQGTGTLTYTDFERIPYLEFDRTTYIDTQYIPNKNTEVTYKVKLYGRQDGVNPVFGVRISYGVSCYDLLQIGNGPRLDWNGTGNIVFLNAMVGNTSTLKIGNSRVLLNDSSVATYTQKETELSHSFFIGNMNENGVVYSNSGSKQDVYLCYLSENGIPKRELIPIKRSDGVKCMYDRVENKYYELIGV